MKQFEYFDRERNVVCVGTFVPVTDKTQLEKNQLFIVPPDSTGHNGKAGCCEGRVNAGHGLPIALYVKGISGFHVIPTKHGGSWIKHRCYVEIK